MIIEFSKWKQGLCFVGTNMHTNKNRRHARQTTKWGFIRQSRTNMVRRLVAFVCLAFQIDFEIYYGNLRCIYAHWTFITRCIAWYIPFCQFKRSSWTVEWLVQLVLFLQLQMQMFNLKFDAYRCRLRAMITTNSH